MLTFDEKRRKIGEWLKESEGSKLWDLMCALRGPDSPSERSSMGDKERAAAYQGRRKRKRETVEVIREKAFFGVIGGAARHHDADKVVLPPSREWDHFDQHVQRAAAILGLTVETVDEKADPKATRVEVKEYEALLPDFSKQIAKWQKVLNTSTSAVMKKTAQAQVDKLTLQSLINPATISLQQFDAAKEACGCTCQVCVSEHLNVPFVALDSFYEEEDNDDEPDDLADF